MPEVAPARIPLRRIKAKGWVGGVCAGFAYWLAIPAWIVRLVLTLLVLVFGFGVLLYILLWIFMPTWTDVPEDYERRAGG